jgi:hypothetical protein
MEEESGTSSGQPMSDSCSCAQVPCPTSTALCWQFFSYSPICSTPAHLPLMHTGPAPLQQCYADSSFLTGMASPICSTPGHYRAMCAAQESLRRESSQVWYWLFLRLLQGYATKTQNDEVTSQICIAPQFQRIAIATNRVTVWTIVMSHMKLILSQGLTWFLLLPLIMILNTRLEL